MKQHKLQEHWAVEKKLGFILMLVKMQIAVRSYVK